MKGEAEVLNNCLIGNATNYRSKKRKEDVSYHGNVVIVDSKVDVSRLAMGCFAWDHPCRSVMPGLLVQERTLRVTGMEVPAFKVTSCE